MAFDPDSAQLIDPASATRSKFDPDSAKLIEASPKSTIPDAPKPPQMTPIERIGTGMRDPIEGIAQGITHLMPSSVEKSVNQANNWLADKTGLVARLPEGGMDQAVAEREKSIEETTPKGTDWYRLAGNVASPANYVAPALKGANVALRVGSGALQGATTGLMQPVADTQNYGGKKLEQGAIGATLGGVISGVGETVAPIVNWVKGLHGDEAVANKAVQGVLKRIQSDQNAGGATYQDMIDLATSTPDKPLVLADVVDANAKGLLGKIARAPGEAKQAISKFMMDRDIDAGTRLSTDIGENLGGGAAYHVDEALIDARSKAGAPLFEKAYEGGSVAPLETQFQNAFAEATKAETEAAKAVTSAQAKVTMAAGRQSQAGNVYSTSGANTEARQAQAELVESSRKLHEAGQAKDDILARLRQAQEDGATNAPGAVWNPRIQQFLDNPRVKQGIARGLRIERDAALAAGRAMNPIEYAIVGTAASGDPIVGKVPTMKLLAKAKEGLDAILESPEMRDLLSGKLNAEGRAVDDVRRSFLNELDAINPDYKKARNVWSGASQSIENLRMGQELFKMSPEEIKDAISQMTQNDREFFKLGAANTMRKMVAQTGKAGDETRRLIGTQYARDQMRAMFDSQEQFDKFFSKLNAEHLMFDSWKRIYGNSSTAERQAEDFTPALSGMEHLSRAGSQALRGEVLPAMSNVARAAGKLLPSMDPKIAAEQGKLLTTPVPQAVERLKAATSSVPSPPITPRMIPGAVAATSPIGTPRVVAPHRAPDGSGAMTTLSDDDYFRMKAATK